MENSNHVGLVTGVSTPQPIGVFQRLHTENLAVIFSASLDLLPFSPPTPNPSPHPLYTKFTMSAWKNAGFSYVFFGIRSV